MSQEVTRRSQIWHDDPEVWRFIFRRYLAIFAPLSLLWEVLQLPLYSLWSEASPVAMAHALVHCTLGDLLIGVGALMSALILLRAGPHRQWRWRQILSATIVLGLAYTTFSEWINTAIRLRWAYSDLMPMLSILPIGLSPLLQWLLVPGAAFLLAVRLRP